MSDEHPSAQEFDFDDWHRLHRADPQAFEARRKAALAAVIDGAPEHVQPRLRGMQFRLEMERARAGSDLAACLKAQSLMWDSLTRLRDALEQLSAAALPVRRVPDRTAQGTSGPPAAQVIAFPRSGRRSAQEQ